MVRNYKKKIGPAGYYKYDPEQKRRALTEINQGRISIRGASRKYGIPYATLNDAKHSRHVLKHGRPTALNIVEEEKLVEGLSVCGDWGFLLTPRDIKAAVKNYMDTRGKTEKRFKENLPGPEWFKAFINRHPHLTVRFSENIKRVRAAVSYDTVKNYFEQLQEGIDGVPPSNVINFDETNFTDDPGSVKVVVRRGVRHAEKVLDTSKTSISVMIAGAADGTILPPYTVYKAKHIYPTWVEGGLPGAAYNRNSSGWFDLIMFEDWFTTIILPHVRRLEGPKILIGDNLSSHLSLQVISECKEHNIRFILLPPNSTHLCQPLDVAYFRPVKCQWRKALMLWKTKNRGVLPKSEFPRLLKDTLLTVGINDSKNIKSGFKACGIYPFNPEEVLKKIPKPQDDDDITIESERSWTKALLSHLQEARAGCSSPKSAIRQRGKRFNVPAGKSIMPDDASRRENLDDKIDSDSDDTSGPSAAIDVTESENEETNIEDENNELKENDFAVVKFPTEKRVRLYVGQIVSFVNKDECIVNFLRKKISFKEAYFSFPDVKDEILVAKENVVEKLQFKTIRRGRFIFPKIRNRNDIE